MVHTGWALAARHYSRRHALTEERAKAARHGLWKGDFSVPRDWRAGTKPGKKF
jgi:endonuclease YncB( thermonuclease family)